MCIIITLCKYCFVNTCPFPPIDINPSRAWTPTVHLSFVSSVLCTVPGAEKMLTIGLMKELGVRDKVERGPQMSPGLLIWTNRWITINRDSKMGSRFHFVCLHVE